MQLNKATARLNKATRPILVESGVLRDCQRFHFRRGHKVITPKLFHDAQFAIVKRVSLAQIKRVLYNIQLPHARKQAPIPAETGPILRLRTKRHPGVGTTDQLGPSRELGSKTIHGNLCASQSTCGHCPKTNSRILGSLRAHTRRRPRPVLIRLVHCPIGEGSDQHVQPSSA